MAHIADSSRRCCAEEDARRRELAIAEAAMALREEAIEAMADIWDRVLDDCYSEIGETHYDSAPLHALIFERFMEDLADNAIDKHVLHRADSIRVERRNAKQR